MWKSVHGWPVIGAAFAVLVGIGVGVLSMTPPDFTISRVGFTAAASILSMKILHWLLRALSPKRERVVVGLVAFVLIGIAWTWSWRWVNHREALASPNLSSSSSRITPSSASPTPTPPPVQQTPHSKPTAPPTPKPSATGGGIVVSGANQGIITQGQSGGQNTINNYGPMRANLRWKQEPTETLWRDEAPHAVLVTLTTDQTVASPHVRLRCDVPIAKYQFNIGRLGSMSSDLPTGDDHVKDFILMSPALTPEIPLTIYIGAKTPIRVVELAVVP